jgi:hypothetical protein
MNNLQLQYQNLVNRLVPFELSSFHSHLSDFFVLDLLESNLNLSGIVSDLLMGIQLEDNFDLSAIIVDIFTRLCNRPDVNWKISNGKIIETHKPLPTNRRSVFDDYPMAIID